jgi:hypothetical protein
LAAAGISFDSWLLAHVDFDQTEVGSQLLEDTIDQMLRLDAAPTVLCCGNDQMAVIVYGILRSMGRKVPDEIGVAGFDNYRAIAEILYPPLTTVDLPYNALGVRAGERLLHLISGQDREDRTPTSVAGPVHWRASINEMRPKKRGLTHHREGGTFMKIFGLAASAAILAWASVAQAQQTLSMWYHGAGNEVERKIITGFNGSQSDWKVELQSFPQAAYNDSVVAGALAGNLPDILDVDGPNMPNWAWAGYMQPLQIDEAKIANFLPGTKGFWNGKL